MHYLIAALIFVASLHAFDVLIAKLYDRFTLWSIPLALLTVLCWPLALIIAILMIITKGPVNAWLTDRAVKRFEEERAAKKIRDREYSRQYRALRKERGY